MRTSVVLYNEDDNPNQTSIDAAIRCDLKSKPDLFIVVGTSLLNPGAKYIAQSMCAAVHELGKGGGMAAWININKDAPVGKYNWDISIKLPSDDIAFKVGLKIPPSIQSQTLDQIAALDVDHGTTADFRSTCSCGKPLPESAAVHVPLQASLSDQDTSDSVHEVLGNEEQYEVVHYNVDTDDGQHGQVVSSQAEVEFGWSSDDMMARRARYEKMLSTCTGKDKREAVGTFFISQ
jgi:hypothetical protein